MREEYGTAFLLKDSGYIEPTGSKERVLFEPDGKIVNGQHVRFRRLPSDPRWAQYVLPLENRYGPR